MLWPAIVALRALGGSAADDELLTKVVEVMQLSPEVQNVPHTDGRQSKVNYYFQRAMTDLRRTGYVDNSASGAWALTDSGERTSQTAINYVPYQLGRLDRV
jgi:restriction system protein